ncbi:MAG: prenyltransferase [Porticoccaceae bacterium]
MTDVLKAVVGSMRPPFLLLTPVCVSIGFSTALYLHGEMDTELGGLVLLASLMAHISTNTLNEFLDYGSGLDLVTQKTPFSGGSGSIPKVPQAKMAVLVVALLSLCITVATGLYLSLLKGWPLLLIGLAGVMLIVLYTRIINRRPWLCLISPGMAFGPMFVLGAYISVTEIENMDAHSVLVVGAASLLPFFLVNNLLLLNQIPDVEADSLVGRVTIPVRYGLKATARIYLSGIILACLSIAAGILLGLLPVACLFILPLLAVGARIYTGLMSSHFRLPEILPFLGINVLITLTANALLAVVLATVKYV